jgi:hypothetical protein
MSQSPFYLSFLLAHLLWTGLLLPADENPDTLSTEDTLVEAETESVQVRIYTLPMRGILTPNSTVIAPPGRLISEHSIKPEVCTLRRNSYSDTLHLIPGKPLRLVEEGSEEGQKTVYIEQELPKDSSVLVGVLDPEPHPETQKHTLEVFPVSETDSPSGWHTFLNGLPHVIEIKLGDTTHNLTPGNSLSLKASAQRERIFITELSGKKSRLYTGAVFADDSRGRLHLIRPRANSERRIDVLSLSGPEQAPQDSDDVNKQ